MHLKQFRRSLIAALPVGFLGFFIVGYFLPLHSNFVQSLLKLPYWILISCAVLLLVFGKQLEKKTIQSHMTETKKLAQQFFCTLCL